MFNITVSKHLIVLVFQLETELGETKKELGDGQSRLVTEHEDRLEKMAAQQEEQLEGATQRARNAREQAANLQSQLTLLQYVLLCLSISI